MKLMQMAVVCAVSSALWAQDAPTDAEGCKDPQIVSRMPKCWILECRAKDFDSADVTVGRATDGEFPKKTLEGKTEVVVYECPESISTLSIARNVESAVRKAGFEIVFSGKGESDHPMIVARKGAQWVEASPWMNGGTPTYSLTSVLVQEMKQEVTADAGAWAAEIEKSGRVPVYGINFDTGKAALRPDSEPVLREIASLLASHSDWKLRVEGHTDNTGAKAANLTLSGQRAASVVAWLVAQGIDKARLEAQGFGDSKPLADNATEEGRAKNRRVELVKI